MTHPVAEPGLRPRTVVVAGLGAGGRRLASALDSGRMPHVRVVDVPVPGAGELSRAFDGADMIVVVCEPGDDVGPAAAIARIANHRNVLVTAVVIGSRNAAGAGGNAVLRTLRRACDQVVIASDDDSLQAIVAALGQ